MVNKKRNVIWFVNIFSISFYCECKLQRIQILKQDFIPDRNVETPQAKFLSNQHPHYEIPIRKGYDMQALDRDSFGEVVYKSLKLLYNVKIFNTQYTDMKNKVN
ncbi:hypothetical protein V6Z11_A02G010600 [Gossypium hirsutum]